jgi:alpha-L-arabinofuranosidase
MFCAEWPDNPEGHVLNLVLDEQPEMIAEFMPDLLKIAGGAGGSDYNWTETLMRDVPHNMMWGLSLHYYTTDWSNKGSATRFREKEYFETLERCDRIKMANIAQTVNVLQSLILTDGQKILLTPAYHVFEMFKVHHDATMLPLHLNCENYVMDGRELPALSASASKDKDDAVHISLVNIDPAKEVKLLIDLRGGEYSDVTGRILTAPELNTHNTFEKPDEVRPAPFSNVKIKKNIVSLDMPPRSIIILEVK